MFPYKTTIQLQRKSQQPLYLQLSKQIIGLIKSHKLQPNTKLPGSRNLSKLLGVHRKTIVACYEELDLQGWVESIPKKGTFVHKNLLELQQQDYNNKKVDFVNDQTGFQFYKDKNLSKTPVLQSANMMSVDDGISDGRLTPINEIARIYRRHTSKKDAYKHLSYGSVYGNEKLRIELAEYLSKTRGLQITKENILITRGSQNGIYLASQLLLKEDDIIIVGSTNYIAADLTFQNQNANLYRVSVDENGLNAQEIERICKKKSIRAVYVTSHHHHPTTVTLSAERRIHLLNLAQKYQFAIIEDDYDYDFNYNHSPILPLASHDVNGNVIYIGSVCKAVAPVFRVGYLIASKDFVDEAAAYRRIVDRQGDALLELTFAEFIKNGDLDRHIKKVMKVYKVRRDLMCALLKEQLSEYFTFQIPKGGMAIWLKLRSDYSWDKVTNYALKENLVIGDWKRYDTQKVGHNAIRLGFASYNEEELKELVQRLSTTMRTYVMEKSS
ncbi:MAG: PLP-dependent aminotransferase family protein [Flavobacteriaceae bacterium]|nr:PLP-dependent aminotransferase family protein [Flavobacteriaceae bacterium]